MKDSLLQPICRCDVLVPLWSSLKLCSLFARRRNLEDRTATYLTEQAKCLLPLEAHSGPYMHIINAWLSMNPTGNIEWGNFFRLKVTLKITHANFIRCFVLLPFRCVSHMKVHNDWTKFQRYFRKRSIRALREKKLNLQQVKTNGYVSGYIVIPANCF